MTQPIAVTLQEPADYDEWRAAARELWARGVLPEQAGFAVAAGTSDLFGTLAATGTEGMAVRVASTARPLRVPRAFPELARRVVCHRDETRFALLYRLLWRLQSEPGLLDAAADRDVWTARRMAKAVRRDSHKMKAFVRFRRLREHDDEEAYVAWFEPTHRIVELTAPFFVRRFAGMRFSIVTPERSAHWNGQKLRFDVGASRADCPDSDALEAHWRVYYASIFNPARLKTNAMRAEMPVKYWRNLPEASLIPELTRSARRAQRAAPAGTAPSRERARELVARQPQMAPLPQRPATLEQLARALAGCQRCGLCAKATGAVAGTGPADARLMLVGEQPGDHEDLAGKPFVGPAGQLLDRALAEAGIAREQVYLTNAVKAFKHELRGKRRLHQRPNAGEVEHCRWWLGLEREMVSPALTVALGATAARALLGRTVRIADVRGRVSHDAQGRPVFVTIHPSYLLRLRDAHEVREQRARFVAELASARALAG